MTSKQAKHTTTIQIKEELANQIKAAGMTYAGAMEVGWQAMQERKEWNQEIAEVRANMETYRQAYLALQKEMRMMKQ